FPSCPLYSNKSGKTSFQCEEHLLLDSFHGNKCPNWNTPHYSCSGATQNFGFTLTSKQGWTDNS
ncbi:unnamed protein product, partial [Staurois parvus]